MLLHEWVFGLATWRERHGLEGGERNADDDVVREFIDVPGAVVMGRRMFSGGSGPWESDPNAGSWFAEDPPFRTPVFVVTHHAREPLTIGDVTFTFVDGVERAVAQAQEAAGEKPVLLAGGADVAQQCLAQGLLHRLRLHVVPVVLGGGVPLFATGDAHVFELERVRSSPAVSHLEYRVS